jgi:hypothetical protein
MRTFIAITLLVGITLAATAEVTPNDQSDYFTFFNCSSTTNPEIKSIRAELTTIPQVGVHTHIHMYATPYKTVYASQITLSVKSLGVQIYKFTKPINTPFPGGQETYYSMSTPTNL